MLVTGAAVADATGLVRLGPDAVAAGVPEVIGAYTLGSSALAADYYDDVREAAAARGRFTAVPVIPDRGEKIRRAALWAAKPLYDAAIGQTAESRVAEVVQIEVARAHRETITENRKRDPQSAGWKRIARPGACKFCAWLASAIYKRETSRFAAHGNCHCVAVPVFKGEAIGPEASVAQYAETSRTKRRTPAQRARVRDILNADFPDAPG